MSKPPLPLRFAERAGLERVAHALALPEFQSGTVWLAGAGRGDPGLITVLGLHAIAGADAGIGGLAYAGIPVTHRDINQVVTFITGHGVDGTLPALDWDSLASGSSTLVLYMALARADEIAAKLIAAGRSADEPAAIIS